MAEEKSLDQLSLATHQAGKKLLSKYGDVSEVFKFSAVVTKINRRGKQQKRVLAITDKAIYNVLPDNYAKCKRRIGLDSVFSLTVSTLSDEFVVHVKDEYDYRYKSEAKDTVSRTLKQLCKAATGDKLVVIAVEQANLSDVAVTRVQARLMQREELLARRLQITQKTDSDDEDSAGGGRSGDGSDEKNETSNLLEGTEKVSLEDFELLKVLGRGSFGKVMQVKKKSDGKVYAMKILKKRAIVARNQVEHTRAERKILESLQHPFLMTLRYAFQTPQKLYFVLDYLQGGELFFHLKHKRRFLEETARIYVGQIALALGHLHSLGFIYRDLKPENILLDEEGNCCLTDFGLSKDVAPEEQAHTFCGTPEYLAPEIVSGLGHGAAVDWWSLGILLYELTVGIPPFYSQNTNEMYQKITNGKLRFPAFLTPDCKDLIHALLNRDPAQRLGSTNDIDDIKKHPFFKDIDWTALYEKKIDPPYKPAVSSNQDTSNFDSTFTTEPVVDSVVPESTLKEMSADKFAGFTFVPTKALGGSDDEEEAGGADSAIAEE